MVKPLGIAIALSIGLGSIIGYNLQKMEANQPQKSEAVAATTSPSPKPEAPKVDRQELARKLSVCLNAKLDQQWLGSLSDPTLSSLTIETCKAKS